MHEGLKVTPFNATFSLVKKGKEILLLTSSAFWYPGPNFYHIAILVTHRNAPLWYIVKQIQRNTQLKDIDRGRKTHTWTYMCTHSNVRIICFPFYNLTLALITWETITALHGNKREKKKTEKNWKQTCSLWLLSENKATWNNFMVNHVRDWHGRRALHWRAQVLHLFVENMSRSSETARSHRLKIY